jgi:hypothetical protein
MTRRMTAKALGVVVWLMAPVAALAQTEAQGVRRGYWPASGSGSEVAVGGGVMDFSGGGARGLTNVGGSWNVRLTAGTRSIVGIEGAYIGSAQSVSAAGLDPSASIVGNGVEGALRLNIPLPLGDGMIEPFGLVGLGWSHFSVVNDDFNTSFIRETDNIMTLPLGAGIAFSWRGLMVDARYTYRIAYEDELLGNNDMSNWIVSANIGAEF